MPESEESIAFEKDGNDFRLVRIDAHNNRSDIFLTESNVSSLMKLVQQILPTILARHSTQIMAQQGIEPLIAVPVSQILLNTDLHRSEILLKIIDEYGNETGFAFPFEIAKYLADRLPARVAEIEKVRPTRQ